jgi:hypothetical protein
MWATPPPGLIPLRLILLGLRVVDKKKCIRHRAFLHWEQKRTIFSQCYDLAPNRTGVLYMNSLADNTPIQSRCGSLHLQVVFLPSFLPVCAPMLHWFVDRAKKMTTPHTCHDPTPNRTRIFCTILSSCKSE